MGSVVERKRERPFLTRRTERDLLNMQLFIWTTVVLRETAGFSMQNQLRRVIKITEFVCKALQHMDGFALRGEEGYAKIPVAIVSMLLESKSPFWWS